MVIAGGLSLIDKPGEPARRQRIIAQMRQAAERGSSLSRQLLAFSRRQPLNPEAVDLGRQIDGMRELLDRTLRGDVHVKTNLAEDLWPIQVDPAELELVVLNLCVNSRDAMPTGGVITISASNKAGVRTETLAGDFVEVVVTDTGMGMSAEVMSHIFEPFFTTKEIGKGSGLGLPQVYGFAQQSGGSVTVNSVLGQGTSVVLLLPRSLAVPPAPAFDVSSDSTGRHALLRGSILVVEDDDEVAALVTEMFRELGYRVTRVASAQAALGALADAPQIDLVFSDVMMPGAMNGVDLAREIARRRPEVPVLLTTGYAGPAYKTGEVEPTALLSKPYEIQQLDAAVRAALKGEQNKR
jgi:CheY-like chemotaxis protein/anti-sigma regulatory factor (Ser/Thr protein kinase)